MEQKHSFFGAPSLLVIFGALFLTVLALLTVNQAISDKNAVNLAAEHTAQRYAALCRGEEILARLRLAVENGEGPETLAAQVGLTEENSTYRYTCEISPSQAWEFVVTPGENGDYTATRTLISSVPTEKDGPAVWDGTSNPGDLYD